MNRSFLHILCVLGFVGITLMAFSVGSLTAQEGAWPTTFQHGDVLVQGTDLAPQQLDQLIETAASRIGVIGPLTPTAGNQPFVLETIRSASGWALMNFASYPSVSAPAEEPVHLVIPTMILGVAQQDVDGTWRIAVEPEPDFYHLMSLVPESLLSPTSKAIILSVQGLPQQPATTTPVRIPGLPWANGQAWRYNRGPHLAWSTNASLDFGTPTPGVSAQVRAADTGVVINTPNSTCLGVRRGGDGLIIWYQHIVASDINDFQLADTVSLGQIIGMTTTDPGCSGESSGYHVHISWQLAQNQEFDPEGSSLNGWVVRGLELRKNGTIVRPNETDTLLYDRGLLSKWTGEYFNNEDFHGDPALVRNDPIINFDWESNSPSQGVNAEHFSVRWTRKLNFAGGHYEFTIRRDDGARLFIDGRKVFEEWDRGVVTHVFPLDIAPGRHEVQFEMHEIDGWASAELRWTLDDPQTDNLLANPSFENDGNGDGRPDAWSVDSRFTRSDEASPIEGSYVGKFRATNNATITTQQTANNVVAGQRYVFSCFVKIPTTSDALSFTFRVQWRRADNSPISNWTVKTYKDDTTGLWFQVAKSKAAPTGTAKAQITMMAKNLNATIFVDNCEFRAE